MTLNMLLETLTQFDHNIECIYLKGSGLDVSTMDYWSDYDLTIVTTSLIQEKYSFLDKLFTNIQGKQVFEYESCLTLRVVTLEDELSQYDFQIISPAFLKKHHTEILEGSKCIFGDGSIIPATNTQGIYKHTYDTKEIDNQWFIFYEAVKKLSRGDYLIGKHLLLSMLSHYLVIDMIDRDIKHQSNCHRFGHHEAFPDIEMDRLSSQNYNQIISFVETLATLYDQRLIELFPEYTSRLNVFIQHLNKSKKEKNQF